MDWISTSQFKLDFKAAKTATDPQVDMAIEAAQDELVELVGQAAVADTLLAVPTNAARATQIVRAHKFLAIAIHLINERNVKREQDGGSPAVSGGMIINEYHSPKELQHRIDQWRAMALRAIGGYLVIDATGDSYATGPEYNHPDIETCADICSSTCSTTSVIRTA